jgi:hypothetical protein
MATQNITDPEISDLAHQVENLLVEIFEGEWPMVGEGADLIQWSGGGEGIDAGVIKGVANFIEELEFSASKRFDVGGGDEEMNSDFDPAWEIRKEFVVARAALNRAAAVLGATVSDRAKRAERF